MRPIGGPRDLRGPPIFVTVYSIVRGRRFRKEDSIHSGIAAAERILALLDHPAALTPQSGPVQTFLTGGDLAAVDIAFAYRQGHDVLHGITTVIRPGERVALVGRTGAGKTTFARLLARLYDPRRGTIRVGTSDIKEIVIRDLRKHVAFITQEVALFADTIIENVRLWDSSISREQVFVACQEVGANAFIERLPQGYDTLLGGGGASLSVGERQLLSFGRILVRRPSLLILDEPTAHVDHRTEGRLLAALNRVLCGRTSIIIAHRPSTLRSVGRVLVIDGGKIVRETGLAR